jgi:hypothetical protein
LHTLRTCLALPFLLVPARFAADRDLLGPKLRDALSGEFDPVTTEDVARSLENLAALGLLAWK